MKCNHDYECNERQICVSQRCRNADCIDDKKCIGMNPKLRCIPNPGSVSKSCQHPCGHTADCGVHQICSTNLGCITPRCHKKAQVIIQQLEAIMIQFLRNQYIVQS